jgi:hypothetical protein
MVGGGIGLGMMVAGQMLGAIGESEGLAAGAAADSENARRALMEGAAETEALARAGRATQGEAIAALGANGAGIGTGSALDLIVQNQIEIEHTILNRRYGAATEAQGLAASAAGKRRASRFALFGGALRAGAAALTGTDSGRGDAAAVSDAQARLRAARLPGGQQLPIPSHLLPMPRGGYGSSPAAGGAPSGVPSRAFGLPGR